MTQRNEFIDSLGAVRDAEGVALHLGALPERIPTDAALLCDHLAVLRVRGEDSEKFLQGQVTADVRDISAGLTRLAMHLNLKGRAMASMRLLPAEGGHDILVPASQAQALRESLGKYIIFSKAEIEADPERMVLSLEGERAPEVLTAAGLPVPGAAHSCAHAEEVIIARGCAAARWLLVLPVSHAAVLWPSLSKGLHTGAAQHARLAEIATGEGHVLPATRERFLPQDLNYDITSGVSFEKGCYTGQEVVARMHHKGKLKQRMRHISWEGEQVPEPGTILRSEQGKAAGEIVQAIPCGKRVHALAVLRLDHEGDCLIDETPLGIRREALPEEGRLKGD